MPSLVTTLAEAVSASGGRALAVGGCVRDHLLGMSVRDWDVEVHGLEAEALHRLLRTLGHVSLVGRSFGVFKLSEGPLDLDVSLPRRDSNSGPGHRGIAVEGDPFMGTTEAARRRDLTVNAIGVDLRTGELVDPFAGARHLRERLLTMVDEQTFGDDPLRAVRAVQFTARLGFDTSEALERLCIAAPLDELPAERIEGEWRKLWLQGVHIADALGLARRTGVLQRVFPEAAVHEQPSLDTQLDVLANLRPHHQPVGRRYALMLAGWLRHAPPEAVEATCDRLRLVRFLRSPLRRWVHEVVRHFRDPIDSDAALRRLSTRAPVGMCLALRKATGDDVHAAEVCARDLNILTEAPPGLLSGRDLTALGVPPSPAMGEALAHVYGLQLDGVVVDRDGALQAASEWWEAHRPG